MLTHITSITHPGAQLFASMTEAQLRRHGTDGIFIAESPKVIRIALSAGYTPVALLMEERHITGDAADILASIPADIPVYVGPRNILAAITGYTLTRGVLCAMQRRPLPTPGELCRDARRVAVLDNVCDTTNIGAIFRSAAALNIDAVLLTPGTCDPLNRRSLRTSMGTIMQVPWTWLPGPPAHLRQYGLKIAALALAGNSVSLDDPHLAAEPRLALVLGTEGDGLSHHVIADADYVVRIPMRSAIDSLNVAAASAVAFWQLCPH